jgi:predicted nucleic acid-binding Zn finger protein
LSESFTKRLKEAKRLVKEKAVKKYIIDGKHERWIVVGRSRDYMNLISPVWCRCYAFQSGIFKDPFFQCKHNLAVKIAMKNSDFEEFTLSKNEFEILRLEWLS